jgi:hypothetical protein
LLLSATLRDVFLKSEQRFMLILLLLKRLPAAFFRFHHLKVVLAATPHYADFFDRFTGTSSLHVMIGFGLST